MYNILFSQNFIEIGGELLHKQIEKVIAQEINSLTKNSMTELHVFITNCINHLLSLDDDTFREIYLKMPITAEGFEYNMCNMLEIRDAIADDDDNDITKNELMNNHKNELLITHSNDPYCYVYACVSNITLIRRCLTISKLPLNNAIILSSEHQNYIGFNLESCILLCEHNFDHVHLLSIAYARHDYTSMKYIINCMSEIELFNIISANKYDGLIYILFIDRIYNLNDDYLKLMCKTKYTMHSDTIISCYYIITYMSIEEGKEHIYNIEKSKQFPKWVCRMKSLLEFHFRPRGSYTKGAIY
jgi:hypothetical protein